MTLERSQVVLNKGSPEDTASAGEPSISVTPTHTSLSLGIP